MVLVGDTWQWTPFMFIVLLAAVENQPRDQVEAAQLDGASGLQIFRDITWPAIAPIAATVVLIRLIEAFKIIDLPNVLTGGGPGPRDGVDDAARLHRLAHAGPRRLGGGRLHAPLRLDDHLRLLLQLRRPAGAEVRVSTADARPLAPPPVRAAHHRRARRRSRKVATYALLLLWSLVVLIPLYWVLVTSFKLPGEVDNGPFYIPFVDFTPSLHAWHFMLVENNTLRPYVNSVVVALASTFLAVLIGSLAAYALVRIRFRVKLAGVAIFIVLLVARHRRRRTASACRWPVAGAVAIALFLLVARHRRRAAPGARSATTTSSSGSSRTASCRRSSRCCRST